MELLQLEYFLRVARSGNVSQTAAEINVAQSSVSRSIARLEESLGFPLFERVGRKIVLNEYGRMYYPYVECAFQALHDGKRCVDEFISHESHELSFSVPISRIVREPLVRFLSDHRDIHVRQYCLPDLSRVREALEQGEIDFALTYQPVDHVNFRWQPLLTEHFYFLTHRNHRLSGRKSVSLRELDGERVVMNESDDPDLLIHACERVGAHLDIVFCGNELEGLGSMVEDGIGCSFIPAFSQYERNLHMPEWKRQLVSVLRIDDEWFSRTLGALTVKHRYMPDATRDFYKGLQHYYSVIAPELENLDR